MKVGVITRNKGKIKIVDFVFPKYGIEKAKQKLLPSIRMKKEFQSGQNTTKKWQNIFLR